MSFKRRRPKEYTKKEIDELNKKFENTEFEKGDMLALYLAAVKNLLPPVLLFLGALYLIIYFIFIR